MRKILFLIAALAWGVSAAPAQEKQRYIIDEVVAIVGDKPILRSELEVMTHTLQSERAQRGSLDTRPAQDEALEQLLTFRLLSVQARLDSLDKNLPDMQSRVEEQINRMVVSAGSVRALEKRYGKEIYSIKDDMLRQVEDEQLARQLQSDVMNKVTVTYSEVRDFFQKIPTDSLEPVPEQYVYAQIVRLPPDTKERKFEVRQTLLGYRQRVLNGENFASLARLYSMDRGTGAKGGEWGPDEVNKLVAPFVEGIENLKPGQVSEVIETKYGYHIVQMISKKGDLVHFRQILLKPQFNIEETERETKLLDSIAKAVGTDKEAFDRAVTVYSMDAQTRQNQGVVYNSQAAEYYYDAKYASTRFFKDAITKPEDVMALSKLKEGEVSAPFEGMDDKGNTIYKIVRLNEVIPSHLANLGDDYEIIETYALTDKQNRVFDKWLDEKLKTMYIYIAPPYRDVQFDRDWLKTGKSRGFEEPQQQ